MSAAARPIALATPVSLADHIKAQHAHTAAVELRAQVDRLCRALVPSNPAEVRSRACELALRVDIAAGDLRLVLSNA